ncbi:SPOR domain-containing protein [Vibrio neonatus]|uniref:SPOR domain-containing protein n=1 Tax=Vibrio neonatus TaxID=278860 RepID=UPI0021C32D92|nr:SPOR domain-containing protein [Vibrio neonatus]
MSQSHKARTLELQSQALLLDKLRLMTRFGSNLVTLIGSRGAGKSWLLERHFSQCVVGYKAKLLGDSAMSEQDMAESLFAQLTTEQAYSAQHSLFENLDQAFGLQAAEFTILVDDAGLFSEEILLSLWNLVERIQAHPTWTINVIMACGPDLLSKKILPLCHQFNTQPVQLNIEPLPKTEVEFFLELMVLRKFESLNKRDSIRKKANRCPQYPGELMALGSKVKPMKTALSSHNGSAKSGVVVIILIIVIALIAWWVLSGSNSTSQPDAPDQALTSNVEKANTESLSGQSQQVADFSAKEEQTLTDDAHQLPPPVTKKTITLDDNSRGQERVVVPDQVVDSLIDTETQVVKPTVKSSTSVAATPSVASAEQDNNTQPRVHFSFARDELLAISSKRYTVQLGALRSMGEVQAFIDEHQLQNQVRIYPTPRSGKTWYIITYQDFRFVKQASEAIEQLPDAVQSVGPWVKSMSQVHKEVVAGK